MLGVVGHTTDTVLQFRGQSMNVDPFSKAKYPQKLISVLQRSLLSILNSNLPFEHVVTFVSLRLLLSIIVI